MILCSCGWQVTTSSNSAKCVGVCSVHNLKKLGSVTVLSTQHIKPTATAGYLQLKIYMLILNQFKPKL